MEANPPSSNQIAAWQEEIDRLDQSLGSILRGDDGYRTSLRTLSQLCGQRGLVPTSYRLSGLVKVDEDPRGLGGFSDVYQGTYEGGTVALKVMRLHVGNRATYMRVFCQEAVYWKRLVHPHIVPFLGVDPQRPACIVSAWMDHGDVMTYISRYPSADRRQLVLDMAHGLEYMHKGNLIHGDIKSGNLLVDGSGRARLSDFGLATTALSTTSIALTAGSSANWGTVLYMAPELLDLSVKSKTLTKESDVYAFGMTAWEIFEGTQPFPDIQNIYEVLHNVVQGKRPSRPVRAEELGLDSFIWATAIESCWETEPSRRPQISEVIEWLVCYKIAREVVPRVLDGGLSDADRDMLNKLQATEIGRKATVQFANASQFFGSFDIMLSNAMDPEARKTRANEYTLVLGAFSFVPPGERQYAKRILKAWLSAGDGEKPGVRGAGRRIMQIFTDRLLKAVEGHTDIVYSVSFSPDGSQIASGSEDNTIRIWNAETGKEVGEPLRGHTDYVRSVSFSRDGNRLVSGSTDGTVRLWDVETGQRIGQPLEGHIGQVTCVAFSPDGNRIVSGSEDKTLRLWDAQTGQAIGEPLRGHSDWVWSVAFSPDGKHIASGSSDRTIRLWDAETGQPVGAPLQGHDGTVRSVAYSPDGARIVSGSRDNVIRIWDTQTRQTVVGPLQGHEGWVNSVAFSPDGKYIVSGSRDGTMRIWDAQTGQTVAGPWEAHSGYWGVFSVAFSPDGKRLVSGGGDNMVKIWDGEVD